jgi:thiamine-phosphate pyrophosphorylase
MSVMPENSKRSVSAFTRSKNALCRRWKLYVITAPGPWLLDIAREAVLGGADVLQLRDKEAADEDLTRQAKSLLELTRRMNVPLLVNDRVSVALAADADGVHLGQEDGTLAAAKAVLGENKIYGRSTHSREQAFAAEREGFDYVGVGPVFETPTKSGRPAVGLELVEFAAKNLSIPFVAIGGIDAGNLREVLRRGARTAAVVRAVSAGADPRTAARELKRLLEGALT